MARDREVDESMIEAEADAALEGENEMGVNVITEMVDPGDGSTKVEAVKDGNKGIIYYNFGANLAEMVEKFGEDVVADNAVAKMKISLQALMRSRLKGGVDCSDLADKWKPGITMERVAVDPKITATNYLSKLAPEELEAMINEIKSKQ